MMQEEVVFKSKTMQEPGVKKRIWKSLKQIQTTEKNTFGINSEAIIYTSINAPPSFKPAKKYSDMTGLISSYTCPVSKIYYHNSAEYKIVKKMPSDISKGYKNLRGASSIV